jgi:hypothetical protein
MSKERELLMRWLSGEANEMPTHIPLLIETQNLLAQPEQEPVAWKVVDRTTGAFMFSRVKPMKRHYQYDKVVPLYESPPTREPLSDEEIFEIGYKAGFAIDSIERDLALDYGFLDEDGDVDNEPYFKLVRAIEKAHGITGIGQ